MKLMTGGVSPLRLPQDNWESGPVRPHENLNLRGRYRLISLLYELGGMSYWVAADSESKGRMVIKFVPSAMMNNHELAEALRGVDSQLNELDHVNIWKPREWIEERGLGAWIYPFAGERNLEKIHPPNGRKAWDHKEIALWASQMCAALGYVLDQTGRFHGALSPACLWVDASGKLLVDGFFSQELILRHWAEGGDVDKAFSSQQVYFSPQMLEQAATAQDDIYCVAAVLYRLLADHPPVLMDLGEEGVRNTIPGQLSEVRGVGKEKGKPLPVAWDTTIACALGKAYEQRPRSLDDFSSRLALPDPSGASVFKRIWTGHRKAVQRGAVALLATVLALVGVWFFTMKLPQMRQVQAEQAAFELAEKERVEEEERQRQEQERLRIEAEERKIAEAKAAEEALRVQEKEEAAVVQARGGLRLASSPAGATVTLNERVVQSPALFEDLVPGAYQVKIDLDGHHALMREIEVQKDQILDLGVIELDRIKVPVSISSAPEGARVYSGEELVGVTPFELADVPTGRLSLRFVKRGYDVLQQAMQVQETSDNKMDVRLIPSPGPRPGVDFTNEVGIRMVWIGELETWFAATETDQEQFNTVMRKNPSEFRGWRRPVEKVTWEEALEFCRRLTAQGRASGMLSYSQLYRLPYEVEWKLAAEGSQWTPAHAGNGTSAVGSGMPNRFGLFNMKGNVWEWCMDMHNNNKNLRVLCGGSWLSDNSNGEAALRDFNDIRVRGNNRGFRVVLAFQDD